MADFEVKFAGGDDFVVEFAGAENPNFKAEMGNVQVVTVGAAPYDGAYTVTPKIEPQTLGTKDKLMAEDVTVKSIPYFEMDNNKGTTVFIGNEV